MTFKNKYKAWSSDEEIYLVGNYKEKTFKEMSQDLGRTPDSIRKYLKSMNIKKKEKDTRIKQACKRGRKAMVNSIFLFMEEGRRMLAKKNAVRKMLDEKKKKSNREQKWSKEFTQNEMPVVMNSPEKGVRLFLLLNGRIKTTIEISNKEKVADKLFKLKGKYDKVELLRSQEF